MKVARYSLLLLVFGLVGNVGAKATTPTGPY